jgi:RNA polymerase sigma factor (sigma-70 family)
MPDSGLALHRSESSGDASSSAEETSSNDEFQRLWNALHSGDSAEFQQLVGDCTPHLLKVIRRRLDRRMRARFDSIDFTQAVWLSFVAQAERLPEFQDANELRKYLGEMAKNKVIDEVRRQLGGQQRDITRELPLSPSGADRPMHAVRSTPSQFAMADERLERLKSGKPPAHQQIIQLKLEGESVPNIAQAVGLSERQVRRVLIALESELNENG